MKYMAVGITSGEDSPQQVTICIGDFGVFHMNENAARKLADDLLRNANFLWPEKQEENE